MTTDGDNANPRVFVSYSWDSDEHRDWVESLATELRKAGIDARLDRWRDRDQGIDDFMMVELERADYVLAICTPEFKRKVLSNAEGTAPTGSGTEMGTAAALRRATGKPTIPILARGTQNESVPANLLTRETYDFTGGDRHAVFDELRKHLLGQTDSAPPLGEIARPEDKHDLPDIFAGSSRGSPARARADKRILPIALIGVAVAAFLGRDQIAVWFGDQSDAPEPVTPVARQFTLVTDAIVLDNCEGNTGSGTSLLLRAVGQRAADEICIRLNGEDLWGCDLTERACSQSNDGDNAHRIGREEVLRAGMNELLVFEEDNDSRVQMGRMDFSVDSNGVVLREGRIRTRAADDDWEVADNFEVIPGTEYETLFKERDGRYRLVWSIR